ncbi:FecR family protein [Bacteroides salyersiae]|jgi:transmembrane sensor|uniref:FecR family protein n=1 Tax=Bacteroides salyersiae TaxID=291644 RepID=UPI001C8BA000|nr:FecR family protein [Bacteroides salyersiae]
MEEQRKDNMRYVAFKYFEGELLPEEEKVLFNFLHEEERNMQLFRKWEEEWFVSNRHTSYIDNKWNRLSGRLHMQVTSMPNIKRRYSIGKKILPYAAIFLMGLVTSAVFYGWYKISHRNDTLFAQSEFFVPRGSQSRILLPDSSVVWLNAGSTLRYDRSFGDKTRSVYIEGEGVFDVTKNKEIPFIVRNEKMEVTVHGTVFNVKSFAEDSISSVALMQGHVSVSCPFVAQTTNLLPGERLIIDNVKKVTKKETFDVDSYLSWHDGTLAFCDEPLSEIAEKLGRRFNISIIIKNQSLKSRRYYLTFVNNETIDQILEKIQEDKNIHIKKQGNTVEIY